MLSCIRCGLCLTSCPTYVLSGHEAEGPRGRIAMMRGLVEGTLRLTPDLVAHEQNCLVCDACTAVCPAGVHMVPLQVAVRAEIAGQVRGGPSGSPWQRLLRHVVFRHVLADMRRFRLLVRALRLYQRLGVQSMVRRTGLLRLLGLDTMEMLLPPLRGGGGFLVPRGEVYAASVPSCEYRVVSTELRGTTQGAITQGDVLPRSVHSGPLTTHNSQLTTREKEAALFAGCVMSTALADIDRATLRVLRRAGWTVSIPGGQGCCGALHAHGGDLAGALSLARRNIAAFDRGLYSGEPAGDAPIVVNAAGCGAMLKEYASHFRADPTWSARAHAFSARVRDVTEVVTPGDLPFRRALAETVTYQDPCHLLHAQRISAQPRALLRAIPGLELREMAGSGLCCGSAGVYNITNPRESRELRARTLDRAAATGAALIVTANPGCQLHLQSGLAERGGSMRVRHIVELLDEATSEL
jgi:glycolate oxidase iron-sulfur subunit